MSVGKQKPLHLDNDTLQAQLDAAEPDATITLWPAQREIQGPIFIRKPVQIDGTGATLWNHYGPVVIIRSKNVQLRNLSIEVTGEQTATLPALDRCAISTEFHVHFQNIKVRGDTIGIAHDEGLWSYPQEVMHLGSLACDQRYEYEMSIVVPTSGQIESHVDGVSVQPRQLVQGVNHLRITVDSPVFSDTLLLGHLLFTAVGSSIIRWIALNAHVSNEAVAKSSLTLPHILWQPPDWVMENHQRLTASSSAQPSVLPIRPVPATQVPTQRTELNTQKANTITSESTIVSKDEESEGRPIEDTRYRPSNIKNQTPKGNIWDKDQHPSPSQAASSSSYNQPSTLPSVFKSANPANQYALSQSTPVKDPLGLPIVFNSTSQNPSSPLPPEATDSKGDNNEDSANKANNQSSISIPDIFT